MGRKKFRLGVGSCQTNEGRGSSGWAKMPTQSRASAARGWSMSQESQKGGREAVRRDQLWRSSRVRGNYEERVSQVLKERVDESHKSLMKRRLALARTLAFAIGKWKLAPMYLVVHQRFVSRTSSEFLGGMGSMCLTRNFQEEIILFHTLEPLVAEGRWIMSQEEEAYQKPC